MSLSKRKILIIGAGMGGIAAGIYGQLLGFNTKIFEMHHFPGGQCTGYQRKGYTFDVCIHHLFGTNKTSKIQNLWKELGVMPRKLHQTKECVSVRSHDGLYFHDYYDLDKLRNHLYHICPEDKKVIEEYIHGINLAKKQDFMGEMMIEGVKPRNLLKLPTIIRQLRAGAITMEQYAKKFKNPFMQKAVPLLEYSLPLCPMLLHFSKHAYGSENCIAWPEGGALSFAKSMANYYQSLNGEIQQKAKVKKIVCQNGKAIGVQLEDNTVEKGDIIISNADGRKTIRDYLDGKQMNAKIKKLCEPTDDKINWSVHVFLGVKRDLRNAPSAIVSLLEKPLKIADNTHHSLEMQTQGYDETMAPKGKGVIKVELISGYSFWKRLFDSGYKNYAEEKQKVANQVIEALEGPFPGIKNQVEVVDVPTLLTWERYMNGTKGFNNLPKFEMNTKNFIMGMLSINNVTLPGLENFQFVGNWVTAAGALFANAVSGKKVMKFICKKEGKSFNLPSLPS